MRVQQVISSNVHFILPVAVIAGFGLVYNIIGGAAGLLYVAGVVAAGYYYSQPGASVKAAVVSQGKAQSFAEELIAEEQAEMEAARQRSSKVCVVMHFCRKLCSRRPAVSAEIENLLIFTEQEQEQEQGLRKDRLQESFGA